MISYLPTIYGAFSRREALVGMLEVRAGLPPSPAEMLTRYERIGWLGRLDDATLGKKVLSTALGEKAVSGALNAAIKAVRADGTYDAITKNYFSFDIYGRTAYVYCIVVLFLFGTMLTRSRLGKEDQLDNPSRVVGILVALILAGTDSRCSGAW